MVEAELAETEYKMEAFWLGWGDSGFGHQLLALDHALLTLVPMVKSLGIFLDSCQ